MNTNDLSDALLAWALAVVEPDLAAGYVYTPASKPDPMPDVIVDLMRSFVQEGGGDAFPMWQLQQRMVEGYDYEFTFTVDNQDPQTAAQELRNFRDRFAQAVLRSPTLDGRVPFRSPFVSFDFGQPFVEYEDGTTGREMTMTLTVGDLVEEEH